VWMQRAASLLGCVDAASSIPTWLCGCSKQHPYLVVWMQQAASLLGCGDAASSIPTWLWGCSKQHPYLVVWMQQHPMERGELAASLLVAVKAFMYCGHTATHLHGQRPIPLLARCGIGVAIFLPAPELLVDTAQAGAGRSPDVIIER